MSSIKEKIITIDMAVSILAILLIGVFLGQSLDLTKSGIPVLAVFLTFFVLAFIIVIAYLLFQYTIRRTYGNDILKPECGCEHAKQIVGLYRWAKGECAVTSGKELTSKKEIFCYVARTMEKYLPPGEK